MNDLFGGSYAGRRVLVTGHTGFKGSWLSLWLSTLGASVTGLALAPETDPAHWNLLDLATVRDLRVDLRDATAVMRALEEVQPEIIFHLAAQPLVRRSYREPLTTFETNVLGLVNLLEAVRATSSVRALVNATTDKVYQEKSTESGYRENDPLGGHDPYSTSKACAELVTECYRKSFLGDLGVRIATARAGNVIGGGDWSQDRLVPDLVRAVTSDATLQIRYPLAIRPWQHVLEPLSGYLRLGQLLLAGKAIDGPWNFGPSAEANVPVQALVSLMQAQWPTLRCELQPGPHPHEAKTLQLDSSRALQHLEWRPVWDADTTLRSTITWYREYHERGLIRSHDDLGTYVDDARSAGLVWAA